MKIKELKNLLRLKKEIRLRIRMNKKLREKKIKVVSLIKKFKMTLTRLMKISYLENIKRLKYHKKQ